MSFECRCGGTLVAVFSDNRVKEIDPYTGDWEDGEDLYDADFNDVRIECNYCGSDFTEQNCERPWVYPRGIGGRWR